MLANVINYFDVDFILPITLVDENMLKAHIRDALVQEKFWWKVGAVKRDEKGNFFKSNLEENEFVKSRKEFKRASSIKNDEAHLYK